MEELQSNQYTLLATTLLGALILSTLGVTIASFLLGYLFLRYYSGWTTYAEYAMITLVFYMGAWIILVTGGSIILNRERNATKMGQFGALVSVCLLSLVGFAVVMVVTSIGLADAQRTLTTDLLIVRTYFATLLGLAGLALFWILIGGGIAMRRAHRVYNAELTDEGAIEALRQEYEGNPEGFKAAQKRLRASLRNQQVANQTADANVKKLEAERKKLEADIAAYRKRVDAQNKAALAKQTVDANAQVSNEMKRLELERKQLQDQINAFNAMQQQQQQQQQQVDATAQLNNQRKRLELERKQLQDQINAFNAMQQQQQPPVLQPARSVSMPPSMLLQPQPQPQSTYFQRQAPLQPQVPAATEQDAIALQQYALQQYALQQQQAAQPAQPVAAWPSYVPQTGQTALRPGYGGIAPPF